MLSDNTFIFKMLQINVKIKSKSKQLVRFFLKLIHGILFQMWDFVQFAVYRTNCFYAGSNEAWAMTSWCLLSFHTSCPSFSHLSIHKLKFL